MGTVIDYTIIRNFRGSWPNWCADVDGGGTVSIYIRCGEIRIGVGANEQEAWDKAVEVPNEWGLGGVSDCTDALVALRKNGYNFVAPYSVLWAETAPLMTAADGKVGQS